jgi:hypothetical protein
VFVLGAPAAAPGRDEGPVQRTGPSLRDPQEVSPS